MMILSPFPGQNSVVATRYKLVHASLTLKKVRKGKRKRKNSEIILIRWLEEVGVT